VLKSRTPTSSHQPMGICAVVNLRVLLWSYVVARLSVEVQILSRISLLCGVVVSILSSLPCRPVERQISWLGEVPPLKSVPLYH
jgi:hypothetical protein